MAVPQTLAAAPRHLPVGVRYVPIAGTHAWRDGWVVNDEDPFTLFMQGQGFRPIRAKDGRPFRWSTDLTGVLLGTDEHDWEAGADALAYFLDPVPYNDRNLIAHSHGGQVAAYCAASRVAIRSLVTVGTPVRTDVPWSVAEDFIGRHIHVYDTTRDWWGWLGSWGDGHVSDRRYFDDHRVTNVPLARISHSTMLRDPAAFHWWLDAGLLDLIEAAPLQAA